MGDLALVWRVRYRDWQSAARYWLQVLGVDVRDQDMFARLYLLYLVALGGVWLLVAGSGVLALAYHVGHPLPAPATRTIPGILTVLAGALITFGTFHAPLLLAHGDLEWLAPSPLSRRALAVDQLVGQAVRTWGLSAFLLAVGLTAAHRPAALAEGALLALPLTAARTVGWALAAIRWSSPGRPRVLPWLVVPVVLVAIGVTIPLVIVAPFHLVWSADAMADWASAEHVALSMTAIALAFALVVAGTINMVTVQEASALYADIRSLGTTYLPNPALVQELRERFRMSRRRVRGRLPAWHLPYLEAGRFFWSQVRQPIEAFRFLEMASLLRSALFVVFLPHAATAWLLWIFVAYRFRRARLTLYVRRDLAEPFLRQFWPDSAARRFVQAGMLPATWVTILALALWWFLPLRVPLTPFRLLWFVGLIVTWYLAEGAGAVRQWESGATTADGHEVAVGGVGIYLLLSAVLHHPVDSLVVPLVLLLWWLRAGRVRTAPATMPATETDRP